MAGLRPPILCLVTDRHRTLPAGAASVVRLAGRAAAAGVSLIQVRERDLDDRSLLTLVRSVVAAVSGSETRVVVNDRTDVAIAAGADGVHLRADSPSPDRVRRIAPAGFLIGRSVHTPAEAAAAGNSSVDYLIAGTVYPSRSKPEGGHTLGLAGLAEVCRSTRVPVLAIGGVTADKVWDISATGSGGVAAIGLFADVSADDSDERIDATLGDLVAGFRRAFAGPAPS